MRLQQSTTPLPPTINHTSQPQQLPKSTTPSTHLPKSSHNLPHPSHASLNQPHPSHTSRNKPHAPKINHTTPKPTTHLPQSTKHFTTHSSNKHHEETWVYSWIYMPSQATLKNQPFCSNASVSCSSPACLKLSVQCQIPAAFISTASRGKDRQQVTHYYLSFQLRSESAAFLGHQSLSDAVGALLLGKMVVPLHSSLASRAGPPKCKRIAL